MNLRLLSIYIGTTLEKKNLMTIKHASTPPSFTILILLDPTSRGNPSLKIACRSRHIILIAQMRRRNNKATSAHTIAQGTIRGGFLGREVWNMPWEMNNVSYRLTNAIDRGDTYH